MEDPSHFMGTPAAAHIVQPSSPHRMMRGPRSRQVSPPVKTAPRSRRRDHARDSCEWSANDVRAVNDEAAPSAEGPGRLRGVESMSLWPCDGLRR
jgi:hypothetical protein